jgi:hypothetical protein
MFELLQRIKKKVLLQLSYSLVQELYLKNILFKKYLVILKFITKKEKKGSKFKLDT